MAITKSATTPTPAAPFEPPVVPPMTVDEAWSALQPLAQQYKALESLAAIVVNAKIYALQKEGLLTEIAGLTEKRQTLADGLARAEVDQIFLVDLC